jgi:hypothetical protein
MFVIFYGLSSIPRVYSPPASKGELRKIVAESVKTALNIAIEKDSAQPYLRQVGDCQSCGSNQYADFTGMMSALLSRWDV